LLVQAYEAARDDKGTFDALTLLREADREDFDTLHRLVKLAEKLEKWDALDGLLGAQIESEADDAEIAVLSRRRARVLADKLDRGDEALALLQELADGGDAAARDEYVALGDKLGWKGIVATKLVDWWFPEPPSAERIAALTGALDRFRFVGRDRDAVKVGVEILRSSRDAKLASEVEALAVKTEDDIGLSAAQEVLGLEVSGLARATELVRQAETRVQAKMGWAESVQHGETGLVGIARLAALIPTSNGIIDLYERQVSRSRGGEAREKALIVAAQVAGEHNDQKRARTFFDLALSGTPTEATLDAVASAPSGTGEKSDALRRTLAEAFAHGGGGVRDGGRSRANFLRRAARIAEEDLRDTDQAFAWLTEALIAHADTATLDALSALAEGIGAPKRMDAVLTHVLTEVFDGPLVRLLLARRAKIRKELLGDRTGAAADLKKLHDLSPTDEAVMAELSALLLEQGDHRSMVQLFEDQILRSKDQAVRAELARKVAQIWESELGDAREAADGWRRVLRLKPGDEEAAQGLDRAKSNMLRKGPVIVPAVVPQPVPSAPAHTESPETLASAKSTPSARPSGPPKLPPVVMAKQDSGQTPDLGTPAVVIDNDDSVEDVDDLDLEEEPLFGDHTKTERGPTVEEVASITSDLVGDIVESPQLEQLLGTTDPFAEADTTHTSIDVRIPMAAAVAMDRPSSRPPASVPPKVPSARASKPPPLPPLSSTGSLPSSGAHSSYQQNEPPTAPGRRLDTAYSHSPSERALAMTDENGPLDFAERTVADGSALEGLEHRHREPPADVLSATDLAMDDDDDDEVLVVDEFVGESDEYEDVVEPSKPPGPMPH
jgi:tetratricopeptide (TPR) repeat protein